MQPNPWLIGVLILDTCRTTKVCTFHLCHHLQVIGGEKLVNSNARQGKNKKIKKYCGDDIRKIMVKPKMRVIEYIWGWRKEIRRPSPKEAALSQIL